MQSLDRSLLEAVAYKFQDDDDDESNDKNMWVCIKCGRQFKRYAILEKHFRVHERENDVTLFPYSCEICSRRFKQLRNKTQHMKVHVGVRPYRCAICKAGFKQKTELTTHKRVHVNDKTFECNICFEKFHQLNGLQVHVQERHIKKERPKIVTVPEIAPKIQKIEEPKEREEEGDTFICYLCKNRFEDFGKVKIHMRCHTGFEPFECGQCSRKFMFLIPFQNHMKQHQDDPNPNLIILDD